jgi:uncharacterized protein
LDCVFLDANVLFSAAYAPHNCLLELWERKGIRLVSSEYAVEEARRNLETPERLERLSGLVSNMRIVRSSSPSLLVELAPNVELPEKDRPVLVDAINTGATHLITGDRRHFGNYFGKRIGGLLIQTPAQYLHGKSKRSKGA